MGTVYSKKLLKRMLNLPNILSSLEFFCFKFFVQTHLPNKKHDLVNLKRFFWHVNCTVKWNPELAVAQLAGMS